MNIGFNDTMVSYEGSSQILIPAVIGFQLLALYLHFWHNQSHKNRRLSVSLPQIAKLVVLDKTNQPSKASQFKDIAYRDPVPRLTIL